MRWFADKCKPFLKLQAKPVIVNVQRAQISIPPAYVAWQAGTTNMVVVPARQIDSEESNPPAYVAWQAGTKNRAGNRFLGSLKGLQIRTPRKGEKKGDGGGEGRGQK